MGSNFDMRGDRGVIPPEASFPEYNFLDLPEEFSRACDAHFHILPVPFERSTCYLKGTRNGPAAIIRASREFETFDEELERETFRVGIHTRAPLRLPQKPHRALEGIGREVKRILEMKKFPVLLGGEHTLTGGVISHFLECFPSLSVLQLDAHADLRDQYEGDPYSHACVMRRIQEQCPFVQVGIRSYCSEERQHMDMAKVFPPSAFQGNADPIPEILSLLSEEVYITLDLDVFDPGCVPGVGTPEPGGFSWFEILRILREVCAAKRVVGFDVVELLPLEGSVVSEITAARLVYRMLGYLARDLPLRL